MDGARVRINSEAQGCKDLPLVWGLKETRFCALLEKSGGMESTMIKIITEHSTACT